MRADRFQNLLGNSRGDGRQDSYGDERRAKVAAARPFVGDALAAGNRRGTGRAPEPAEHVALRRQAAQLYSIYRPYPVTSALQGVAIAATDVYGGTQHNHFGMELTGELLYDTDGDQWVCAYRLAPFTAVRPLQLIGTDTTLGGALRSIERRVAELAAPDADGNTLTAQNRPGLPGLITPDVVAQRIAWLLTRQPSA